MKTKIKKYFESLNPKKIGLKNKIKVSSIQKLGMGTSNANFLVNIGNKKFVFRLNMHKKNKTKIKEEFYALKLVEKYNIAPKPILIDNSKKFFDSDFLILKYIEGKTAEQLKPYKTTKGLKKLAELISRLHSIKINGELKKLPFNKEFFYYKERLKHIDSFYIKYIKKSIKNKTLLNLINETRKKLGKVPKNLSYKKIITQGDFCEQNIIINKNKYSLVDFESLSIENQYAELAFIIITFKGTPFNKKQKKIFLEEYKKIMKIKDPKFENKVEQWIPILQFIIFLWAIKHVLRTKNKEFHSHFLENNDFKEDLKYLPVVLKCSIKLNVIDKKYKNFNIIKAVK